MIHVSSSNRALFSGRCSRSPLFCMLRMSVLIYVCIPWFSNSNTFKSVSTSPMSPSTLLDRIFASDPRHSELLSLPSNLQTTRKTRLKDLHFFNRELVYFSLFFLRRQPLPLCTMILVSKLLISGLVRSGRVPQRTLSPFCSAGRIEAPKKLPLVSFLLISCQSFVIACAFRLVLS